MIEDESFRHWVFKTDASAQAYWEDWIGRHPEHLEEVEIASEIIRGIQFSRKKLSPVEVESAWQDLQYKMRGQKGYGNYRLWAASLAGLAMLTAAVWLWLASPPGEIVYETPFGKTGSWLLPDGSKLTLNAHSKAIFKMRQQPQTMRVVSIEGEAYFEVVHLEEKQVVPFLVKTPDLTIKVLGTEFNVSTRRGRTQVVLDAGKVQLQLPTDSKGTTMNPGELVEYASLKNEIRKENVDTEIFTSWRRHLLKFDDTPLDEVALIIEDNYGVEVTFEDPNLRIIRVTGEISDENLETLLVALSKLFDLNIEHSKNTVRFRKVNKP